MIEVNGELWVHNDSGNPPQLFQMSRNGTVARTLLIDAPARDWEDLAALTSPGKPPSLLVADIGDNRSQRSGGVTISRVEIPEATAQAQGTPAAPLPTTTMHLRYPDGPRDAEALLIDPRTQGLYIVTKPRGGWPDVYSLPHFQAGSNELAHVVTLSPSLTQVPLHFVTAGDVSEDGAWIVLRTYTGIYLFPRLPQMTVAEALSTRPCPITPPDEPQGESIAFGKTSKGVPPDLYTVSEGTPTRLYRLAAH